MMTKNFLKIIILFFIVSIEVQAQQKQSNYIFSYFKGNGADGLHLAYSHDGYNWKALKNDSSFLKPVVSADKLMRDPCIIKGGDGLFHMVWTVSWNDKGIGYATSKDLINWSEQQFLPVMVHEKAARNTWAPEITYDQKSKTYMIYWATTITGRFEETASKKESGYNHRMYYVTTKDFKTFSDTKLLYDPGFNSIDATIVENGKKFLMIFKDETIEPPAKDLKIAQSKQLTGPYGPSGPAITRGYWAEGPTVLKNAEGWLVYFDKYRDHKYGAVFSSDLKNWEDVSHKISLPKGIRHGSILEITAEEMDKIKAVR
jgi:hypothetical protein